jgi:hypothetical protein
MNPNLSDLVAQYADPRPNTFPDVGNPAGLPSFQVNEPSYVFAYAGPLALAMIFTGPGLKNAVFNAAIELQEHGMNATWWSTVTPQVAAAVAAYALNNPGLVPVGSVVGTIAGAMGAPPNQGASLPTSSPVALLDAVSPIAGVAVGDLFYALCQPGNAYQLLAAIAPNASGRQISQAINLVEETYAGAFSAYDPSTYAGPYKAAIGAFVAASHPGHSS